MSSTNDITGDRLVSKTSQTYRDKYDEIDNSWIREQVAKREQQKATSTGTSRRDNR